MKGSKTADASVEDPPVKSAANVTPAPDAAGGSAQLQAPAAGGSVDQNAPGGIIGAPGRSNPASTPALMTSQDPPAGDGQKYGAAAPSLADPACKAGTSEFAAAKVANEQLLKQYRGIMNMYEANNQAKPDMKAYSETRDPTREGRYGHLPGVAVGDEFVGRGELAVLGLHSQMMQGINNSKKAADTAFGAYAICLSGGYKDDDDDGQSFWYTGAGGQGKKGKIQVEDQTYKHSDNAALLNNHTSGTPVRVFRAKVSQQVLPDGRKGRAVRLYVYEGLYQVVEHRRVQGQDGPLVVQFRMQGVPGHAVVSSKVEYKCLEKLGFRRLALAGGEGRPAKRRRRASATYQWDFAIPTPDEVRQRITARKTGGRYERLVTPDVSAGLEKVPIPMWNALDADDTITTGCAVTGELMPDEEPFKYMAEYIFGEQEAKDQAVAAEQHFRATFPHTCGIQYHGGVSCYTEHGQLKGLEPCGVMECDPDCTGPQKPAASAGDKRSNECSCKGNAAVSGGIIYPLEVFKVAHKGWGVRCAVDVPVGAVLCTYIGTVITDSTAEQLKDMDTYLFNLDHFYCLEQEEQEQQQKQQQQEQQKQRQSGDGGGDEDLRNPNLPHLRPDMRDFHLVVDASHEGNVGRFINHSCDPNCVVQAVFAKNARSQFLYYNAIVAQEDIPAYTEITYNYSYQAHLQGQSPAAAAPGEAGAAGDPSPACSNRKQRLVACHCGAANCCKYLLKN